MPPSIAMGKALALESFGPTLYLATEPDWIAFLGDYPGACVYVRLLEVRYCEGAVPEHIGFAHGAREAGSH